MLKTSDDLYKIRDAIRELWVGLGYHDPLRHILEAAEKTAAAQWLTVRDQEKQRAAAEAALEAEIMREAA